MRGVVFAGLALVGVAALSAVTQQAFHELPWSGSGLDLDDFGDKFDDLAAVRPVHAAAAPRRASIVLGDRRARRQARRQRRPPEHHAGVRCSRSSALGMILVGMLGGALAADRRPRPAGHGVRGGRRSSTSSTAPCSAASAASPGGCRSGPGARVADRPGARPRPARRAGHRPRLAAVLHRRLRRPAGRLAARTTTTARPSCGTSPSPSATR